MAFHNLSVLTEGRYWSDWRVPHYLTDKETVSNDIVLYSRKFSCPKPYTQYLRKEAKIENCISVSSIPPVSAVQRAARPGEGCTFRYRNPDSNRFLLSDMQGYYSGRVFLIGNAPSIAKLPLHLLRNEFTIAFNRFDLFLDRISWVPTMYMCIDSLVCPDIAFFINKHVSLYRHVFVPTRYKDSKVDVNYTKFINDSANVHWFYFKPRASEDNIVPKDAFMVETRGTVASVALEILSHLGFGPIYVIGVDLAYQTHNTTVSANAVRREDLLSVANDDPNHFDPRYFGAGRLYHDPRVPWMTKSWEGALAIARAKGVSVYNAGLNNLSESNFPRVSFRSLFTHVSAAEERLMFLQDIEKDFHIRPMYAETELSKCIPRSEVVSSPPFLVKNNTIAVVRTASVASHLSSKLIASHITRGPLREEYILIPRLLWRNRLPQ